VLARPGRLLLCPLWRRKVRKRVVLLKSFVFPVWLNSPDRLGDDSSERYSEFVVALLNACTENGLPPPPVVFTNVIQVNVAKKASGLFCCCGSLFTRAAWQGEKKLVTITAQPSGERLNSDFGKAPKEKDHYIIYSVAAPVVKK
jgi:hypothetical protein